MPIPPVALTTALLPRILTPASSVAELLAAFPSSCVLCPEVLFPLARRTARQERALQSTPCNQDQ